MTEFNFPPCIYFFIVLICSLLHIFQPIFELNIFYYYLLFPSVALCHIYFSNFQNFSRFGVFYYSLLLDNNITSHIVYESQSTVYFQFLPPSRCHTSPYLDTFVSNNESPLTEIKNKQNDFYIYLYFRQFQSTSFVFVDGSCSLALFLVLENFF